MGLLQKAYETYNAMERRYAGAVEEGRTPLAPVSHTVKTADLELMLDHEGHFISATALDKKDPKAKTIIPVTEESLSRSSNPSAHPLCDQIQFLAPYDKKRHDAYLGLLTEWAESPYSHPILMPVLKYIRGETILNDLSKRDLIHLGEKGIPKEKKALVRWKVVFSERTVCSWTDKDLFRAFYEFYKAKKEEKETGCCMLSGEEAPLAGKHPKNIVPYFGNAKLISSNDTDNFTYLGRFENDEQALTVGYEASQKAHIALQWLCETQGVLQGDRLFACWNPKGKEVPRPDYNTLTYGFLEEQKVPPTAPQYKELVRKALYGRAREFDDSDEVVFATFNAPTDGRLSVTYYGEMLVSNYFEKLMEWDSKCCWAAGGKGYRTPSLLQIVHGAFGTQRKVNGEYSLQAGNKVASMNLQRLVICKLYGQKVPRDIEKSLVDRACSPCGLDGKVWRRAVFTACAVINKNTSDIQSGGNGTMKWALDNPDRSFQFGRLLAVMERLEQDYYYSERSNDNKPRMTTAIKSLGRYRKWPFATQVSIREHLWEAYYSRVSRPSQARYDRLVGEIMQYLSSYSKEELEKPLDSIFLLGYDLQRNEFFAKAKKNAAGEEDGDIVEEPAV